MSYTVAARSDPEIQAIEDDRRRRALIARFDLLQTRLSEFEG